MANQSWIITTAVGAGERGYAGDGGPAAQALLNGPFDIGFDGGGNLYFSDTFNHCIRRVDARSNVITTVAGCGEAGYSGDGGPATRARFNEPYGIAVDRDAATLRRRPAQPLRTPRRRGDRDCHDPCR